MHLEQSVGEHFTPRDVKVWTKDDKVHVSVMIAKEEKTENWTHRESRNFYQVFTTPDAVDFEKMKVELVDGCLLVEAPLLLSSFITADLTAFNGILLVHVLIITF